MGQRAILLERRGRTAAALREDGAIVRTRRRGEIGETVELEDRAAAFPAGKRRRWLRGAAAAVLALAITGGTVGYTTASAYVSLDVEDSAIELTVNHFDRVIAVNALNEDAAELARMLSGEVRHQPVGKALSRTVARLHEDGRFDDMRAAVVAGIASDSGRRAAELARSMEDAVGAEHPLYVSESSRAERRQALERRISVGRFGFERDHRIPPPDFVMPRAWYPAGTPGRSTAA